MPIESTPLTYLGPPPSGFSKRGREYRDSNLSISNKSTTSVRLVRQVGHRSGIARESERHTCQTLPNVEPIRPSECVETFLRHLTRMLRWVPRG
jgi:hypothetical protein